MKFSISTFRKMATSSHLNWLIVRDHNAFMLKQRNIPKPFSKVNIQSINDLLTN